MPQAALHHTISSVSGSNSVKQIGQSPKISLRLDAAPSGTEADVAGAGAVSKISCSSWYCVSTLQTSIHVLRIGSDLLRTGMLIGIEGVRGL